MFSTIAIHLFFSAQLFRPVSMNFSKCFNLNLICIILGFFSWVCTPEADQDVNQPAVVSDLDVRVVISSQANARHSQNAHKLKAQLEERVTHESVSVELLHESWPEVGSWTIFPLLTKLIESQRPKQWVFLCEEGTAIDIERLFHVLSRYDPQKEWFVGRGIWDEDATIIHHFAFHDNLQAFLYPNLAAGFALSLPLIRKLEAIRKAFVETLDFSIDRQHEFAKFVWNDGKGSALIDVPEFCIEKSPECATHFTASEIPVCVRRVLDERRLPESKLPSVELTRRLSSTALGLFRHSAIGGPVRESEVFFAVKTCTKYERDRVPIILDTWGNRSSVKLFGDGSEGRDSHFVNLGIPNTVKGHCAKTVGILHHVVNDRVLASKSWIVIADDDTLMSVPRLLRLLSCYSAEEAVAIGERYGFRTASQQGYDYITGGGGIVLSMAAVKRLVGSGLCVCPSADTPDDMFLGLCLKLLSIPVTHVPNFHQARPADYSADLLNHQEPISFHKFWLMDPIEAYDTWLRDESSHRANSGRDEL